jgi:shikimate dehydrogenase
VTEVSPAAGALVIGGGATACSALAALRQIGARDVAVAMRDTSRSAELEAAAKRLDVAIRLCVLAAGAPAAAELVVCTVPPHAADAATSWLLRGQAPRAVFDVAYDPWPTRLAVAARGAGSIVVGGFDLLLHQAARQVELMTGQAAPLAAMRRAGLAELAARAQHPRPADT